MNRHGNGKFEIPSVDPNLCTHMIYSFAVMSPDGGIMSHNRGDDFADHGGKDGYAKTIKLKEKNPELKVMIAMGGYNDGSQRYSQ